nr:hypothetical protein Iba_chr08eCG4970 [Ipomoea batatas]
MELKVQKMLPCESPTIASARSPCWSCLQPLSLLHTTEEGGKIAVAATNHDHAPMPPAATIAVEVGNGRGGLPRCSLLTAERVGEAAGSRSNRDGREKNAWERRRPPYDWHPSTIAIVLPRKTNTKIRTPAEPPSPNNTKPPIADASHPRREAAEKQSRREAAAKQPPSPSLQAAPAGARPRSVAASLTAAPPELRRRSVTTEVDYGSSGRFMMLDMDLLGDSHNWRNLEVIQKWNKKIAILLGVLNAEGELNYVLKYIEVFDLEIMLSAGNTTATAKTSKYWSFAEVRHFRLNIMVKLDSIDLYCNVDYVYHVYR